MSYLFVGTSANNLSPVKTPSAMTWGKIMVSEDDAGRVKQDARMYVKKITDKVSLSLTWNGIFGADVSRILKAFDHEYIFVKYLDPKENKYLTKEFYPGDMSAPVYSYCDPRGALYQSVSFQIIER